MSGLAAFGLLFCGGAQAQIFVQDGSLNTAVTSANSTSVSTSFTVSAGAQVLVVSLMDRNNSLTAPTNGASPSSLLWGTQAISRIVSQNNLTSHYADSDIFYLWDPTPGTQTITATDTTGQTPSAMTMQVFTLSGVNTNVAPVTYGIGNTDVDNIPGNAISVTLADSTPGGAWAVVNASGGDEGVGLAVSSSTGVTNWVHIANVQSQVMGAVENLSGGVSTITAYDPTHNSTQIGFAVAVFAPGASTPAPTNVVATGQLNQVALSWQDASGGAATNYIVLRSTASGGGYSAMATNNGNTATNYTDASVADYVTYYYVVEAAGPIGLSPFSSPASAFAVGVEPVPTGLSATPLNTQVALAWNATPGATGYNILRTSNSPSGFTTIGSSAATTYTDTGLSNGMTYYYEVNATNSFGTGPNSAYVSAIPAIQTNVPPAYPLRPSANGRYVVDANNAPFLMIGDSPHTLMVNLDEADAAAYLVNRGSNGFNSLWANLLCDDYDGGPGSEGNANYGQDIYGDNPFTNLLEGGYYDLTTPNPAYWSNVDYVVHAAATNGLQILSLPLDEGGWTQTSLANGSNRCYAYGQFLGSRYASTPNIFWNLGNDFDDWYITTNESVILAIAWGILSQDTNHPMTIELNPDVSQSLDDPNWWPLVTVNAVYTYYPTYAESYAAWNQTNVPALLLEANYEFADNTGGQPPSPWVQRVQEYWSLLAGCLAGHIYGNHYTYKPFTPAYYNTPGMTQLMYFKQFFASRPWYHLVPDQNHYLVTAGYGIFNSTSTMLTANNYVTAAMTPDGTLGVAYAPTNATLTVAMTNFIGPVTASWFDPSANTYLTIPGSPFSNTITTNLTTPGTNAAGDTDWVLLLQVPAPPLVPPQITGAAFNGSNFVVSFSTVSGQNYALQNSTVLGNGSWSLASTNIPGTGGIVQATDTNTASQSRRFYRVQTGR
ncbi:MAG: DUF4038 domain-containing protein [Verrucomicrobiota bacterium]